MVGAAPAFAKGNDDHGKATMSTEQDKRKNGVSDVDILNYALVLERLSRVAALPR